MTSCIHACNIRGGNVQPANEQNMQAVLSAAVPSNGRLCRVWLTVHTMLLKLLCKQSPIFASLSLGVAFACSADAANCFGREKIGSDTGGFVCVDSRKTQLRGGRQAGVPRGAANIAAGIANSSAYGPCQSGFA